uniref:ATP synthase subunit a n=1 Tax=Mutilla europaea TaxID=2749339 RepID=A0A7L7S136_9HYME|nr:ATP synthase F0 subunit 6 [Mutilla europaea]
MMGLFSSFNPISTNYASLGWIMMISPILIFNLNSFWTTNSPSNMNYSKPLWMINMQMKSSIKKFLLPNSIMIISILIIITSLNISGLMPMVFSTTSQICINISLAIPMWIASILFKSNNLLKFMAHLNPLSTPMLLIPLMIIIESVSLLIQPLTLAIRLTANITAGHILMSLISASYHSFSTLIMPMNMLIHLTFTILELGV